MEPLLRPTFPTNAAELQAVVVSYLEQFQESVDKAVSSQAEAVGAIDSFLSGEREVQRAGIEGFCTTEGGWGFSRTYRAVEEDASVRLWRVCLTA